MYVSELLRDSNRHGLMINRRVARQSISYLGSQTLAYTECLNFILQSEQFGEDFVLPRGVETLLIELGQTFVISDYNKFIVL